MAENEESAAALSRAIDQTAQVMAAVRVEQVNDPTPCADWDVGQLMAHLAVGAGLLLEQARGTSPDWSAVPDRVDDPAATFRASPGQRWLSHSVRRRNDG